MIQYRIYEYITSKKSKIEEYREMGCRAGMQRLVYEGKSNYPINILLTHIDEKRAGYTLKKYDVIEILNQHKVVTARLFYSDNSFHPFELYSYNPDPEWDS